MHSINHYTVKYWVIKDHPENFLSWLYRTQKHYGFWCIRFWNSFSHFGSSARNDQSRLNVVFSFKSFIWPLFLFFFKRTSCQAKRIISVLWISRSKIVAKSFSEIFCILDCSRSDVMNVVCRSIFEGNARTTSWREMRCFLSWFCWCHAKIVLILGQGASISSHRAGWVCFRIMLGGLYKNIWDTSC